MTDRIYFISRKYFIYRLEIADVSGRRVRTLVPRPALADRWEATWDGRDDLGRPVPSGVYLVRLPMEGGGTSARVHLLR